MHNVVNVILKIIFHHKNDYLEILDIHKMYKKEDKEKID